MATQSVSKMSGSAFTIPEPDLTPKEMIDRARAMRPILRENRVDAANRGTYSPELHKMFSDAGFYRIFQPRMFGGYEFDLETYFKVMIEISSGDPGIGWCLTLGSGHTLPLIAHFPEHVLRDIFTSNPEFIAPHSAFPRGTATPVPGGYRVKGQWAYSSGVPYSTHFMGTALVPQENGPNKMIVALLPRSDYTILNDWGGGVTMALNASGSNTVEIDDAFVPIDYTADWDWIEYDKPAMGMKLTGNGLYGGNTSAIYHGELACTQVGAARAALDEFERIITTKKRLHPPQILRYLHPDSQRIFGECSQMVDAAEAIVLSVGREYMTRVNDWAAGGPMPTAEQYMRLGGMLYSAIRLSWEAGELMFRSVGSGVAKKGEPLQDYFLTLAMQRTQAKEFGELQAVSMARSHFGLLDTPVTGNVTEVGFSSVVQNPLKQPAYNQA